MIQYTTPTIRLTVEGVDITAYRVYVTLKQGAKTLTITDVDTSPSDGDTQILLPLSQVQTGGFSGGDLDVQVNWWDSLSQTRNATTIGKLRVQPNLLRMVVGNA